MKNDEIRDNLSSMSNDEKPKERAPKGATKKSKKDAEVNAEQTVSAETGDKPQKEVPIIKISNLNHNYFNPSGETPALRNINLEVNKGDFVAIVGPSGCGKTTMLSLLSGLMKVQRGSIEYEGEATIPKGFFGYMLQKDELFDWLSVKKNILLPLEILKIKTPENIEYAMKLCE